MVRAFEERARVPVLPEFVADRVHEEDRSVGELRAVAEHEARGIGVVGVVGVSVDVHGRGVREFDGHVAARRVGEIERRVRVPADGAVAAEAREAPAGVGVGLEHAWRRGSVGFRVVVAAQAERPVVGGVVPDVEFAARREAGRGLCPETAAVERDDVLAAVGVPRRRVRDRQQAGAVLVADGVAVRAVLRDLEVLHQQVGVHAAVAGGARRPVERPDGEDERSAGVMDAGARPAHFVHHVLAARKRHRGPGSVLQVGMGAPTPAEVDFFHVRHGGRVVERQRDGRFDGKLSHEGGRGAAEVDFAVIPGHVHRGVRDVFRQRQLAREVEPTAGAGSGDVNRLAVGAVEPDRVFDDVGTLGAVQDRFLGVEGQDAFSGQVVAATVVALEVFRVGRLGLAICEAQQRHVFVPVDDRTQAGGRGEPERVRGGRKPAVEDVGVGVVNVLGEAGPDVVVPDGRGDRHIDVRLVSVRVPDDEAVVQGLRGRKAG